MKRVCLAALLSACLFSFAGTLDAQIGGFRRGDCNGDGLLAVSDVVYLTQYAFAGAVTPPCVDACDANDDGSANLTDMTFLLQLIFLGAPTLPPPGLECGWDPTPDSLPCDEPICLMGNVFEDRTFTLPTAAVGREYSGSLPALFQEQILWDDMGVPVEVQAEVTYLDFGLEVPTDIPFGLEFDPATGTFSGVPEEAGHHELTGWARLALGLFVRYHVDLAIFSADDSEIVPGQTFTPNGPNAVFQIDDVFTFTHELPWPVPLPLWACNPQRPPMTEFTLDKPVRIYLPIGLDERRPLLVFHHGAGYEHDDYDLVLEHIASYGYVVASVRDLFPFFTVQAFYCFGGHDEAARVLLGTREFLESLDADPGSLLFESIDPTRIFYGGHSRGGSAAIIAREMDPRARGVIALQPTEAKADSFIGNTTRFERFPEAPMLIVGAEQDDDVQFPSTERLLERFTGHGTMANIYGGCHGYTTDVDTTGCNLCTWGPFPSLVDECRYIPRTLQRALTRQLMVAFLKRHGDRDLSVEGILYGEENEGSVFLGVTGRRNLGHELLVDDFSNYPLNAFGETVVATGFQEVGPGSCYDLPDPPPAPLTPIENLVLRLRFVGLAMIDSPLAPPGSSRDLTEYRRFVFRMKNADRLDLVDNFGYGWLDAAVVLVDANGNEAEVSLDAHLPQTEFHPDTEPAGTTVTMKYQRYLDVSVTLDEFIAANGNLDLSRVVSLRLRLDTNGTATVVPRLGLDDLRFE